MNPCIQDASYYYYLHNVTATRHNAKVAASANVQSKKSLSSLYHWDYIVMNDQTIYPGIVQKRQKSLKVLTTKYAKLFVQTAGSRPVFMATYAFIKSTTTLSEEVTHHG